MRRNGDPSGAGTLSAFTLAGDGTRLERILAVRASVLVPGELELCCGSRVRFELRLLCTFYFTFQIPVVPSAKKPPPLRRHRNNASSRSNDSRYQSGRDSLLVPKPSVHDDCRSHRSVSASRCHSARRLGQILSATGRFAQQPCTSIV